MKEIYLVRHGQALDDIEGLFGGAADHPPTQLALDEAAKFAEGFRDKGVELIITSPYLRAKVPAEIVASILGLPLHIEPDLRERNQYGILTGMKRSEAAEKYPDLIEALAKPASQIEGAEDNALFRQRVQEALNRIRGLPQERVLVFTHMGSILAALDLHFRDMEVEHFGFVKIEPGPKPKVLETHKAKFLV